MPIEKMMIVKSRLLKSKKNALINKVYSKLDSLRTHAYTRGDDHWFHQMNDLCIWVGEQREFKVWEEEEEIDLGTAIITP